MSEERIVEAVQGALRARGVEEDVVAAGQFEPRGFTGGIFVGGLAGDEVAGSVGFGAGMIAGMHAAGAARGLPTQMLVGVTATTVYGFDGKSRRKVPTDLVFQVPRDGLSVKVHQRVNVRVVELIHEASGSKIELEGNRLPVTHSKDVIHALTG